MTLKPPIGPNDPFTNPRLITDPIYHNLGSYDPDGSDVENQATPVTVGLSTGAHYNDNGSGSLFHFSSYVENPGSRATVAVFGSAKGKHAFGGNFIGYSEASGDVSVGIEIDYGCLVSPGTSFGLVIKSLGGNVGGEGGDAHIQMQASTSSAAANGIIFNAGSGDTAVATTGNLIKATDENCTHGVYFSGSRFTTAAAWLPLNSGSTSTSQALVLAAEGGFANTGSYLDIRANGAGSQATNGIIFRLSGGNQPITGSLITTSASLTAIVGLNLSNGTFSTAGIAMGDNNISAGTATGVKIGTATSQKIGFYNKTPVVQQTGVAVTAAGVHAALVNLGLITA